MPIVDPEERRTYQRAWLKKRRAGMTDKRRKYDWAEIQALYDSGLSARRCIEIKHMSRLTWHKALRRGDIVSRGRNEVPFVDLKTRGAVKRRLIGTGALRKVCVICGVSDWMGKPLTLVLDHENGINDDHAQSNLRLLCPNCNSQTETLAGRNVKRKRLQAARQAA